jgi:hypothetical protein
MPPHDDDIVVVGEKVQRQQQQQQKLGPPYRPSPLDVQPQDTPRRLLTNDTIPRGFSNGGAGAQSLRPPASSSSHAISSIVPASTPTASARGIAAGSSVAAYSASSATKAKKPISSGSGSGSNNADAAWMHRLYPFDGPTIEEFTPLFNGVDIDRLVDQKLAVFKDKFLAQVVKGYYGASNRSLPLCLNFIQSHMPSHPFFVPCPPQTR